jgi:hypothetical protein
VVGTHFMSRSDSLPYMKCDVRMVSNATAKFSWSRYRSSLRLSFRERCYDCLIIFTPKTLSKIGILTK